MSQSIRIQQFPRRENENFRVFHFKLLRAVIEKLQNPFGTPD